MFGAMTLVNYWLPAMADSKAYAASQAKVHAAVHAEAYAQETMWTTMSDTALKSGYTSAEHRQNWVRADLMFLPVLLAK